MFICKIPNCGRLQFKYVSKCSQDKIIKPTTRVSFNEYYFLFHTVLYYLLDIFHTIMNIMLDIFHNNIEHNIRYISHNNEHNIRYILFKTKHNIIRHIS